MKAAIAHAASEAESELLVDPTEECAIGASPAPAVAAPPVATGAPTVSKPFTTLPPSVPSLIPSAPKVSAPGVAGVPTTGFESAPEDPKTGLASAVRAGSAQTQTTRFGPAIYTQVDRAVGSVEPSKSTFTWGREATVGITDDAAAVQLVQHRIDAKIAAHGDAIRQFDARAADVAEGSPEWINLQGQRQIAVNERDRLSSLRGAVTPTNAVEQAKLAGVDASLIINTQDRSGSVEIDQDWSDGTVGVKAKGAAKDAAAGEDASGSVNFVANVGADKKGLAAQGALPDSGAKGAPTTLVDVGGGLINQNGVVGAYGSGGIGGTMGPDTDQTTVRTDVVGSVASNGVAGTATNSIERVSKGDLLPFQNKDAKLQTTTTRSFRFSRSGEARLDEVPIPGTDRVNLTLTLSAGASIGGSLGVGATGGSSVANVGVEGSVGAGGTLVYTHEMTRAEADAYAAEVQAMVDGSPTGRALPEFAMLGRLRAFADTEAPNLMTAAVDSGVASTMPAGDSVEMRGFVEGRGSASVGADAGMGGPGFKASVSGSERWERSVKVEKIHGEDGREMVRITMGFADASSAEGAIGASAEGASVGLKHSTSAQNGDTRSFVLDPNAPDGNYDARFELITHATSPDLLAVLARNPSLGGDGFAESEQHTATDTLSGAIGVAPFTVDGSASHDEYGARNLVVRPDGVAENAMGGQKNTLKTGVGGATLLSVASSSAISATTANGDLAVTLRRVDEYQTPGFGGAKEVSAQSLVADAAPVSVEKLLTEKFKRVSTFGLTQQEVTRIARSFAPNWKKWISCASGYGDEYFAWVDLRSALMSPVLNPEIEAQDPDAALFVAWCDAFAAFGEAAGPDASMVIFRKLRRAMGGESGDEDPLGTLAEWPPSIADQESEFDSVREAVAALGQSSDPEAAMEAKRTVLAGRCDTLYARVEACADFRMPSAKLELLATIGEIRGNALAGRVNGATSADRAEVDVPRLEALMPQFKLHEQATLAEIEALVAGGVGASSGTARLRASELFTEVRDLYRVWVAEIVKLRRAYCALPTPPTRLLVSIDANAPHERMTEPDIDQFLRLAGASDDSGAASAAAVKAVEPFRNY